MQAFIWQLSDLRFLLSISEMISSMHFVSLRFRFPADLLFTSSSGELWRMVRIGGQPLGFGKGTLIEIPQIYTTLEEICQISPHWKGTEQT